MVKIREHWNAGFNHYIVTINSVIGKYGIGVLCAGEDALPKNKLFIINICFPASLKTRGTPQITNILIQQIDYFSVSRRWKSSAKDSLSYRR